MRVRRAIIAGVAAALWTASVGHASSVTSAVKIKKAELPDAVREAVDREAPGAHVVACWRNVGDRAAVYEVDLKVNGRKKGLVVSVDGEVLTVEEQVAWDDLPPAVQRSFRREAGDHDIEEVNAVAHHGEIAGYVARIDGEDSDYEYAVGPGGGRLEDEEASRFRESWRQRVPKSTP
jgi:hypothetical protein